MGYNLAAAFLPEIPRPKFFHPFEGPVKGFSPNGDKVLIFKTGQDTDLLDLRARWLNAFLVQLEAIAPEIPRDLAVEWVNSHFPKTADDLAMSLTFGEAEKLAFRLADAWDAA